jgi:3-hydroxyisobutyrate dehydrogenase-like beta-hydroxyacid dehydrogenase
METPKGLPRVAFLGLGVMGAPMAGHLATAGYPVTVYNRTPEKAERWLATHGAKNGARTAPTPAAAAQGAELVLLCVGNDHDVRGVVLGEHGALAGMTANTILVDHTTASAQLARELYGVAKGQGVGFLDAPVSGGQAGAEGGKLTVMVGGDEAVFARAQPVLANFARAVTLMGGAGSGQLTKMMNQICIAGLVQALSEGIAFATQAGLDVPLALDVISKGAAQSWQMESRGKTMVDDKFDFGFAVDWMRKDLSICLAEARANGAALPVTAMVDQFYARIQARGGGRWDTSSLIRLLQPPK